MGHACVCKLNFTMLDRMAVVKIGQDSCKKLQAVSRKVGLV